MLLSGEMAMLQTVRGDEVETTRTSQRGTYGGSTQAYIPNAEQTYMHSLRATQDATFLALPATEWAEALREWFPLPIHLLEGLVVGMRRTSTITSERERLLALGSLSAGLTHELNNPAAAAQRATESLRSRVAGMRHKLGMLACGKLDGETIAQLVDLQEDAVEPGRDRPGPLGRWRPRTPRTSSATGSTSAASPAPGTSRRSWSRAAWTPSGWTRSSARCPKGRSRPRSAGSPTPSRPRR